MTNAGKTSGKRSFNPPPIISHAPQGFAGAPGPTDEELRRALFLANLALYVPLAVGFALLLLVQWIEHARCSGATDSTNETICSSDSSGSGGSGGSGGGGGGGGGASSARFGGFGAMGAGHGGGGG